MAKNRDINYNDWTKNATRRQGLWVSYRNPNDNTYYAVVDSGLPGGTPDPDDNNRMVYKPMTEVELSGRREDGEPGLTIYNYARNGIKSITKKVLKTRYKIVATANRVNGKPNFGPGLWEVGDAKAAGLTYEWSREQNPRGKYLLCIRMTQAYVDEWVFFGQPPPVPEPTEEEAEVPKDERDDFTGERPYATLKTERAKQKKVSTTVSEIRKPFTLKSMQKDIEMGEQVLREYAKILRREGVTPEDLNGFDISRQTRLYKKSYAKSKQLLQANSIKFDEKQFTEDDKIEFVLDKEFNLLHFLYNETTDKRADLEQQQAENSNTENSDITSVYYDGFDRRDLAEDELMVAQEKSVPVFLPESDADLELPENKRATKYNLMRDRSRNRLRGWSSTTLSMLANTDKILEQHKNIGTDDLLPWTEFLSQCVYPNPCIKPIEVKQRQEEPRILTSLDKTSTNTTSQVAQHNAAASIEVKEKRAEKRKEEFNIIESSTLNCGVDLEDMLEDLESLYGNVLNKYSFKSLLSAAAEKAKNEMRNQAAIFTDNVQEGVESEVRKVVDSVINELECGVDVAKGKLEDKFLSPLKEIPGVNDLLSNFEPPEMTFDLPSIKITSFLSVITDQIEEAAIDMIESTLISMVSEMVKDFIDCEKVIAIDGVDDKGNGLFDAFSKAAFGEANLADIIDPASVRNISESLGIPENRIDSINNAISEVTTPEELLSLMNGEASEEILRRLSPIINEELQGVANMTIEVLAGYLARIGETAPEEVKNQIFEAKTETVFCNDLDYQDAAQIMKDILGTRAVKEAKAAFDRNKEKLKSLCGLKASTAENLAEAITEMPMPDKMSQAINIAADTIIETQVDIINKTLDAVSSGKPQQDPNNFKVYTNDREYLTVEYNPNDGFFRLGKWALATGVSTTTDDSPIAQYSYTIASRGGMTGTRTPYNIAIPQGEQAGEGTTRRGMFNDATTVGVNLFTNIQRFGRRSSHLFDIRDRFQGTDLTISSARQKYFADMKGTINVLYAAAKKPTDQRIKNASKAANQQIKNIASLGVILRSMLPFAVNGFRTLARAAGGVTPLWFPNDIITNKLVTEYVYELIFSDVADAFYIRYSGDQYGDGRYDYAPSELIRRGFFDECRIPTNIRQQVRENMVDLYSAISKIEHNITNITPGIAEEFDKQAPDIAAAKKVISLLLNVLLPYKAGVDRTAGSQEAWMGEEIQRRIPSAGLRYEFPLQALIALHVIQGFHDNSGWRQASYRELGPPGDRKSIIDINFRALGKLTPSLFQKTLEDDDTELPKL